MNENQRTFRDWWHDLPGSVQVFVMVALIAGALLVWAKLTTSDEPSCPRGFIGTTADGANCGVDRGDSVCFIDPQTGQYVCVPKVTP